MNNDMVVMKFPEGKPPIVEEQCYFCNNKREVTAKIWSEPYHGPWICDECRKGIIWAKEQVLKAGDPG